MNKERKVRLTINPTEEVVVPQADYTDLKRWGLIASGASAPAEPPAVEEAPSTKTSEAPAKGTDKKE